MPMKPPAGTGQGFPRWEVVVEEVGDRSATCKEVTTSRRIEIALFPVRVPLKPQPGDHWLVDQSLGAWTFMALVSGQSPW